MKISAILLSCLAAAFAIVLFVELTQDQPIFNQIAGNKSQVRGTSFSYSLSSLLSSSNPLRNHSFKKQKESGPRNFNHDEMLGQESQKRQLKPQKSDAHDPEYRSLDASEGNRQLEAHKDEPHDLDYRALGGQKLEQHPPDYRQLMSNKIRQLGNHRYENARPVYGDAGRKLDYTQHLPTDQGYPHDVVNSDSDSKFQDLMHREEVQEPDERMVTLRIPGDKVNEHGAEGGSRVLADGEGFTGLEKMFMSTEAQKNLEMDTHKFVMAEKDGQQNFQARSKALFGNKFDHLPVKTNSRKTSAKMVDSGTAY